MQGAFEPLVRFARATNLQLAGRAVAVGADVPDAERLRAALVAIGAREGGRVDVAFVRRVPSAEAHPRTAPTLADGGVVVLAEPLPAGRGFPEVLPGVVATGLGDAVAVLPGRPDPDRDAHASAAARIDFARRHMPVTRTLAAGLAPLVAGRRVGISLVLEPKTAVLALLLTEAGADVHVFAFAIETDDAVADVLRARGVTVHASAAATGAEERASALALLDARPDLLIDDGGHLIRLAHAERPDVVAGLIGASEETTSGLTPLRAMAAEGALRIPVIAANDARSKTWFDNRHGTGESCVLALMDALDVADLAGTAVAVIGFGPVGQGCAQVLRAFGAEVVVVERDPVRALQARYGGYATAALPAALAGAEVVVSATGVPRTLDAAALRGCREDAVIAVAGGVPEEVALADLPRTRLGPQLERIDVGIPLRLVAGGECVNIVAGQGNPIGIMDLSFGVVLGALRQLLGRPLPPGVHPMDPEADAAVAALATGTPPPAAAPEPPPWDWRRTRFG